MAGARGLCAATALCGVLAATGPAAGQSGAFRTSAGVSVTLPPVNELDCAGLDAKLSEIDRTGYRGNGPSPLNSADSPLLAYEHKVARALYTRCARDMSSSDAATALRRGFRASP